MNKDFISEKEWEEILVNASFDSLPTEFFSAVYITLRNGKIVILTSTELEEYITEHDQEIDEIRVAIDISKIRSTITEETNKILLKTFG